jgi:O-antigen/teichoic acid export membrane protein
MIQFFKNKIQANKEAMLLYVGNSFITLSSFLIIALLSHFLPIETYGIYRYIITISTLAITLGSLGFANALYYYLANANFAQYQSKINSNRLGLIIMSMITLFLMKLISFFFFEKLADFQLAQYQWVIAGIVCIGILQSNELHIFLTNKKIKVYLLLTLSVIFLRIASLFIAYYQQWTLLDLLKLHLLWSFVSLLINQVLINRFNQIRQLQINWKEIFEQFKYGFPIGLGLFFGVLLINADRIILSAFYPDPTQFAILSNGNFEVPIITQFYISFSTIALPMMIEAYKQKDFHEFFQIRAKYQQEIMMLLFPIVFALINWSGPVIRIIFGQNYTESAALFAVFASSFLIRFTSHHDVFLATNQTRYISIIQGVELIFHLILTYVLISYFGMIGASYAYLITNIFYFIFTSYYSAKIMAVSIWKIHNWKHLPPNLLICGFILLVFKSIDAALIYSDLQAILLAFFYVISTYIFLNYRYATILKHG